MDIQTRYLDGDRLRINTRFEDVLALNGITSAEALWRLDGEPVKKILRERGTERSRLKTPEGGSLEVYVKRYERPSLKEILKCRLTLKPVFMSGAIHEWEAILAFHREGIPTMVPMAAAVLPGGRSVNMTLGIEGFRRASDIFSGDCSLSDREKLVDKIADLAGKMHRAKFAHRDFYLVHLFVTGDWSVLPIDLQRVIMGKHFARRWQVKDLAQLLFSCVGLMSRADMLRFWRRYATGYFPALRHDKAFVRQVMRKADRMLASSRRKKALKA